MDKVAASAPAVAARHGEWLRDDRWQTTVAVGALVAAALAVWVTLSANFLRYPGWLAAQKADFVVGPALAGLYWVRRRPHSPFGPLLLGWALVGALYILQSSSQSWLFTTGLLWEKVFGLGTYLVILAFPTGRLDRPSKIVLVCGVVSVLLLAIAIQLLIPQVGAGGSISSCSSLCPRNELAVTSKPGLALDLFHVFSYAVFALALVVLALLVHRFVTGTPPRRRALAIGMPVAVLFLVCEMSFQLLNILEAQDTRLYRIVIWVFVAARAGVWYGFLFALLAAELFAARALKRLVEQSLHHPSREELEVMLREPLGDPRLALVFLDRSTEPDAELLAVDAGPGRDFTVVQRDGSVGVALLHDAQLNDDPELLQAAGSVALLAAENARLDAGWQEALDDLRQTGGRIAHAVDRERRRVALDLHDGVQQRLSVIHLGLASAAEADSPSRRNLRVLSEDIGEVIDEVRTVSHGLHPQALEDHGLVWALEQATPVPVRHKRIRRYAAPLEAAVYYSCLEAVQNATKHAGPSAHISMTLDDDGERLRFEVADDGGGFDLSSRSSGLGLQSLQDRIRGVGGRLSVTSRPGGGTVVSGSIPIDSGLDEGSEVGAQQTVLEDETARAAVGDEPWRETQIPE